MIDGLTQIELESLLIVVLKKKNYKHHPTPAPGVNMMFVFKDMLQRKVLN